MKRVIATLCAVLLTGCYSSEPPSVAGSAAGLYETTGPMLTIGIDETSGSLLWQPRSIAFLSTGHLLVADRDMTLREFDLHSAVIRHFGRAGAGPGEFRQLTWAVPIRGDSIAVYDGELHRVSVFSHEGNHARSVPTTEAGITVIAGISESARLLGFPLPIARDPLLDDWGRTPVLLVDLDGEPRSRTDTLVTPVWLRCNPANERFCAPHPDADQRRRGVLAAGREHVFIAPARGGTLYIVDLGTLEHDSIPLPDPYRDAVVEAIVPIGRDSAWMSLDHLGTPIWLRYAGPDAMTAFKPPANVELRAAQGSCVAVWHIGPTGAGVIEVYHATESVAEEPASRAGTELCN